MHKTAYTDVPVPDHPRSTHGLVIISMGRSQEMHFTRSNSFLEDTLLCQPLPQLGPMRPCPPQAVLGGGCRSIHASGPGLPPRAHYHWPGLAQLNSSGPY